MLNIEQFIYTGASISGKRGYQIVAKSKGISDKLLSQLDHYLYPIDIFPSEFKESRSLIVNGDRVVYSRIKNIGIGYDGRDDTLYNHSFVVSRQSFEEYNFDSRIFDELYLEDQFITGILPNISIDPLPPTPGYFTNKSVLYEILFGLFMNKKIAVLYDDIKLPQTVLSLIPASMRDVSFSTCVIDYSRQPKYQFIMGDKIVKSRLGSTFQVVTDDPSSKVCRNVALKESILYYAKLILSGNYIELEEINTTFENISHKSNKDKLILVCNFAQFQKADEDKKSKYAENILKVLEEFDVDIVSFYGEKISKYVKEPIGVTYPHPMPIPWIPFVGLYPIYAVQKIMGDFFNTMYASSQDNGKSSTSNVKTFEKRPTRVSGEVKKALFARDKSEDD